MLSFIGKGRSPAKSDASSRAGSDEVPSTPERSSTKNENEKSPVVRKGTEGEGRCGIGALEFETQW